MTAKRRLCWEDYLCRDRSCPVFGDHITGNPERMEVELGAYESWRGGSRGPVEAMSCDYFSNLRQRGRGRRHVDQTLSIFLERALRRSASFQRRLSLFEQGDLPHLDELNLLGQFSQFIPIITDTKDVCFALLTVITAGQGLGFNRAMLFWNEEEQDRIYGYMGIGPGSDQEASRIWKELAEQEPWLDLRELVNRGLSRKHGDSPLAQRLVDVSFPSDQTDCRLGASLWEVQELSGDDLTHAVDRAVVDHLDLQHFVTLPLVRGERSLGFLLVDNRFSGMDMAQERIDIVHVLVRFATGILENLLLRQSLERSLSRTQATMKVLADIRGRIGRAEKLAASGELSAAVAHEIRNPLTAIGGFSRRLMKSENLSTRDRETVSVIVEESQRLEEILGRLLDTAQREEIRFRQSDINAEIARVISLIGDKIAGAGIDLSSQLTDGLPQIPLNTRHFSQVMLNLVQNAIEAIDGEGTIQVRTEEEPEWVLVHVTDSGCGMAEDECRKIFKAFYTTKSAGSGLGLSHSQRVIRMHGGELSVESKVGRGTCFTIRLPRRRYLLDQ
jgi:signal transduction histidine kinase